jgi:lipoprotein-releasing system permease protein
VIGGRALRAGAGHAAFGQAVRGAMVRGILPDQEDKVADFRPHMKSGKLDA